MDENKGFQILARHPCSVNDVMIVKVNTAKEEFRKKYKAIRLKMPPREVVLKSRLITERMLDHLGRQDIKSAHIYRAIPELNEVDTADIIERIRQKWPSLDVMLGSKVKNLSFPQDKFDLIIVPVLAFDKQDYRLGWGGGWYDRFLADQPEALKIGLSFQNGFMKEGLPHEHHDIRLDMVIAEV